MLVFNIVINFIKLLIVQIYYSTKNRFLHKPSFAKRRKLKIAIIGAGISGVTTAIKLKKAGYKNFTIFEKFLKVGGVWHANRYPGCASESPSKIYQMHSEKIIFKEKYASSESIQKYLEDLCLKYELFKKLLIGVTVQSADWDSKTNSWILYYDGKFERFDILISGTGRLHKPHIPDFKGKEDFQGMQLHTATWGYKELDFSGKRVGIIGTGASGAQLVPSLYKTYKQNFDLFVFQRSAAYCLPKFAKTYGKIKMKIYGTFPVVYKISQLLVFLRQDFLLIFSQITWLFNKGLESAIVKILQNKNYKILRSKKTIF